jgi:hypothetical protein
MRAQFITELMTRGLVDADTAAELRGALHSPRFALLVDGLGLDRGAVLAARCAAWGLQPARVSWLAWPIVGRVAVDEDACRRLGAVPVLLRPLTIAFKDPEAAFAAHAVLPPHTACLADATDIDRLQSAVFGRMPPPVEDPLAGGWLQVRAPAALPRTSTPLATRAPPWACVDDRG